MLAPFFTADAWHDGDRTFFVEATAYPGSGRLIITGLKNNDPDDGQIDVWNPRGYTFSALEKAIFWLESQQSTNWFQALPCGPQRLDLKRRVLINMEAVPGRKDKVERETLADVHIHFPQHLGSWKTGCAIVVALAQLMRGSRTKVKAWYTGCVQPCGRIFPMPGEEKEVTRQDFDVLVVPEYPGDEKWGYPKNIPEGKRVLGCAHASDVVKYIYRPEMFS